MGIDIQGEKSGQSISIRYSSLQYVRLLAYAYCRIPFRTGRLALFGMDVNLLSSEASNDKVLTPFDLSRFIYVGYQFPNLVLHSDCEGGYTMDGKVDLHDPDLEGGSLKGLYEELKLLIDDDIPNNSDYTEDPDFGTLQYSNAIENLERLYKLVEVEVSYSDGKVTFS